MRVYWCRTCGKCWAAVEPPTCFHGDDSKLPPRTMVPIPDWHPMSPGGDR